MKILLFLFLLILPCRAQDVLHRGTRPADFDRPQPPTGKPAELLEPLDVAYPDTAMRRGWEGVSVVAAWVDRRGAVTYAEVSGSSGFTPLDSIALEAVLQGYFKAAQRNGRPVGTRVSIPVEFRLRRDEDEYDAIKSSEQLQQEAQELRRAREMYEEEQRRIEEEIRQLKERLKRDTTDVQGSR